MFSEKRSAPAKSLWKIPLDFLCEPLVYFELEVGQSGEQCHKVEPISQMLFESGAPPVSSKKGEIGGFTLKKTEIQSFS